MNKKIMALVVAVAMLMQIMVICNISVSAADTKSIVVNEDFSKYGMKDNDSVNNSNWKLSGTLDVKSATYRKDSDASYVSLLGGANPDGKTFHFYNKLSGASNFITGSGCLVFNVRLNSGQSVINLLGDGDIENNPPIAVSLKLDGDTKTVMFYEGGTYNSLIKVDDGVWVTVKVDFNTVNQTYSIEATDGNLILLHYSNMDFRDSVSSIATVEIATERPKVVDPDATTTTEGTEDTSGAIAVNPFDFDINDITVANGKASDYVVDGKNPNATKSPTTSVTPTPTPSAVVPTTTPTPKPTATPTPIPVQTPVAFSDVSNHWAKLDIELMVSLNVIKGYSDGTFKPDASIKRAEFVSIVRRLLGVNTVAYKGGYSDVKAESWYASELQAATDAGLIDSALVVNGNFSPEQPITREEMTSLISKAYEFAVKQKPTEADISKFADGSNIAPWATNYVKGAVGLGIIKGFSDNTFKPKDTATRAQAAAMLSRLLANFPGGKD